MTEIHCGSCKRLWVRWNSLEETGCPRAEYEKSSDNRIANDKTSTICDYYEPKRKVPSSKQSEKPEMEEALAALNKNKYICPTDTEELLVYFEGIYKPAKHLIWFTLEELYNKELSKHFVEEVYAHLQRANVIKREKINSCKDSLPLQNGIFNLNAKSVTPFSPEEIFTYKLNVEYKEGADCPNFKKFLRQILSEEDIPLLQETMGYCLLAAMPLHKIFWWYGKGRNGKGRVGLTLQEILGEESYSNLDVEALSRRFVLQKLYGKLLNISSEPKINRKYGIDTTVLKKLSGEDTINAEVKHSNKTIDFTNFAKCIVMGNRFPKVEDDTIAWWDRVSVLNFPNTFLEDDENTIQDIEKTWLPEEKSGIFNFMLTGLHRLLENGKFTKSKTAEETKVEFMKLSDPFTAWILERCVIMPQVYLTREEAFSDCCVYCDEIGTERVNKRVFYEKLRGTRGVKDTQKKVKGKNENVFEGIRLKKDDDDNQKTLLEGEKGSKSSKSSKIGYISTKFENNTNGYRKNIGESTTSTTSTTFSCFNCGKALTKHEIFTGSDLNQRCADCNMNFILEEK
ncbi:hypothetical protein JW988_03485 [Candidatus Bathyarchaeota archaeon]|nr:hypothetical protein [Candidatus Bathyarchaeota archaeon]